MNLHEFQGKSILKKYGVAIQEGKVIDDINEAFPAAKQLSEETGTSWYVVKAQIHAGGRGKGVVKETGSHGVVLVKGIDQLEDTVKGILEGHLVTAQTSDAGKKVNKVLCFPRVGQNQVALRVPPALHANSKIYCKIHALSEIGWSSERLCRRILRTRSKRTT